MVFVNRSWRGVVHLTGAAQVRPCSAHPRHPWLEMPPVRQTTPRQLLALKTQLSNAPPIFLQQHSLYSILRNRLNKLLLPIVTKYLLTQFHNNVFCSHARFSTVAV